MGDTRTFRVTLVKVAPGLPYFEVGAYQYVAEWLPVPGDTITITRNPGQDGVASDEIRGFVTRVDPMAETPISVTEVTSGDPNSPDDYLA